MIIIAIMLRLYISFGHNLPFFYFFVSGTSEKVFHIILYVLRTDYVEKWTCLMARTSTTNHFNVMYNIYRSQKYWHFNSMLNAPQHLNEALIVKRIWLQAYNLILCKLIVLSPGSVNIIKSLISVIYSIFACD